MSKYRRVLIQLYANLGQSDRLAVREVLLNAGCSEPYTYVEPVVPLNAADGVRTPRVYVVDIPDSYTNCELTQLGDTLKATEAVQYVMVMPN